jgi:iron(III) transport system permease protein
MLNDRGPSAGILAFIACVGAFLAAFLIYPVLYVFREAFWINGRFSLLYFQLLFQNQVRFGAIINSLLLGLTTTALTTLLAVPLAFIATRYRFPRKGLLTSLLLVPMIMPPFVGAIGMLRLLSKQGSINLLIERLGFEHGIDFLAGGFWGVVFLQVLHLYPIMYLNVAAALANVDPSLEDAARNMGDSGLRLFRKITLPLMLPGYFAGAVLVFIWSFTDLGTPLIFNYPRVAAVHIFDMVSDVNTNPMAYALVVAVIALTGIAFIGGRIALGRGHEMISKGPSGRREHPTGRWGTAGIWLALLLVTALALLPHLSVFLTSVTGEWSDTVLPTRLTGRYYTQALSHELARIGVRNSLMLSFGSTLIDVVLGVGIAYVLVRKRFMGSGILDALAMMPLALPGVVLAFGYVVCFRDTPLDPRTNPFPLLIIAYSVRRLPFMVRSAYAGFQQTGVALEEAAMNVGATPTRALFKITVPLIMANLIAGAILSFAFAMLEVSDSLILASQRQYYPLTKAIYALHQLIAEGDFIASALGIMAMALLAATLIAAGALLGRKMGQLFRV